MSNISLFKKLEGTEISQYRIFQPRLATLQEPQYHLQELIGVGGYGGVFRANQVNGDRYEGQVAIKLIEVNRSDTNQLNELQASVSFDHINLVQSSIVGDWKKGNDEFLFLVMQLAETSLQKKIQQNILSVSETKQMVIEIATGLNHLHSQRKIHRDFKPGNVLRINDIWKISDFGLIRDMEDEDYVRSATTGTYAYMPPEAFQGITSPPWDIWSLGILIIESFTQKLPYRFQTTPQLMYQVMNANVIIPDNLPDPFGNIVKGCLKTDCEQRWTAQQVIDALNPKPKPIILQEPITLQQDNNNQFWEDKKVLIVLGLLAAISGMFLLFFAFKQPDPPPQTVSVNRDILPSDNLDKINAESSTLLSKAKEFAGKNLLESAIATANKINPRSSVYNESQKLINQWSESLLQIATAQYQEQGKLKEAIAMLKSIPVNSNANKKVIELTSKWQAEWKTNEANKNLAEKALKDGKWNDALISGHWSVKT